MKDFRSELDSLTQPPGQTIARVYQLIEAGHLSKGLRMARRLGVSEAELRPQVLAAARAMFRSGRTAELLSVVGVYPVDVGFSVDALLRRAYDNRDYHGFLKQAYRLRAGAAFAAEIKAALQELTVRGRSEEAKAWTRKFGEADTLAAAERAEGA